MSSYYREQGFHSRKRIFRRLRFLVIILFLAVLLVLGYLLYDIIRQARASDKPSDPTTPVTSTITSGSQILRTDYFEFRAPNKWRAVTAETKQGHYVYRQFNSSLVEQEFVVDVDSSATEVVALTQTTRVLPVRITDGNILNPEIEVSDHCGKAIKTGDAKTPQVLTYKQVKFACVPDGRSFVVVVGAVGGTNSITLKRPNGSTAVYKMTYKNLTATPSSRDLMNIVKSFEVR